MTVKEFALLLGVLSNLAPVSAAFLRGRSRFLLASTSLVAVTVSVFLLTLIRLAQIGPGAEATPWVYTLLALGVPVLLAGFLLSVGVGRERPEDSFRDRRGTFLFLGAVGLVSLVLLRHPSFLSGYSWEDGKGTIYLGPLGKAYLSYLLIGVVMVAYNLESTYRLASSQVRHHLRLTYLGFFGILAFFTFILSTGIIYSTLGLGKMMASGLPIAFANFVIAYGFLRGTLTDVAAPVSRKVVYSSFSAMAAGLYVLAVGIVAQVATFTKWSPDEVVTLSLGFLAVLTAMLLVFSNRFQRRVRRFIDRNFYVNRYDYRTQWTNVTHSLNEAPHTRENVLRCAARILRDVFLADQVTIALLDPATMRMKPVLGKGQENPQAILRADTPLPRKLMTDRQSLLLDRRPDDFEYIPIYAENRDWLDATASQIVAPLLEGGSLVGMVGLERGNKHDPFTFEDTALLDSVSTHISASLRSVHLAETLAEAREMEALSHWSNMLLHDIKNYLSPLRMIAQNMITHQNHPEINEVSARDINRVADRMESLTRMLSELREAPQLYRSRIDWNALIQEVLKEMQIDRREALKLELNLEASTPIYGDRTMLKRVVENLVSNAVEAMRGAGTLTMKTEDDGELRWNGSSSVVVSISDTGEGMSEEFIREKLFRPFVTTKHQGLGLGLYQCRSIVRAHHGELRVLSEPGRGTTFQILLDGESSHQESELSPATV